jgi:hypothetical protein
MMGCACNQSQSPAMMSGLMGALLVSGSEVQVGFSYNTERGTYEDSNPDWVRQVIVGSMLGSGAFTAASAVITESSLSTYIPRYITVYGKTAHDFADEEDVGGFVYDLFREFLPDVNIYRVDSVLIRSVPPAASGNPGVAQPNIPAGWNRPPGAVFTPTPTRPSPNCPEGFYDAGWLGVNCKPIGSNQPGRCDFDAMEFDDWLGCALGVTPATGVFIGAAAVLAVILIAKR